MAASSQHRQLGHTAPTLGGPVFGSTGTVRKLFLGLSRVIFASLPVGTVSAAPLSALDALGKGQDGYWPFENSGADDANGASTLVLYVASVVLVLLGGAFAGLTIA